MFVYMRFQIHVCLYVKLVGFLNFLNLMKKLYYNVII